MMKSSNSEVQFQLRKLITKYSDLFAYHQWPSEQERWSELVFALVTKTSHKPETEIRDIVEELDELGLLDVEELSKIPEVNGNVDYSYPFAKRIIDCLSESRITEEQTKKPGLTEEESRRSVSVMRDVAKSLIEHHDGKVQKYLRKYGQQMVDEIANNFTISAMKEKDMKYAFVYWLQNVLNMPLNLATPSVETFGKDLQIDSEDLVKEADKLDINIALLDDMIDQHM